MSHVIVDGVIDIPRTKGWLNDTPDAKLDPGAVSYLPFFLLIEGSLFEEFI